MKKILIALVISSLIYPYLGFAQIDSETVIPKEGEFSLGDAGGSMAATIQANGGLCNYLRRIIRNQTIVVVLDDGTTTTNSKEDNKERAEERKNIEDHAKEEEKNSETRKQLDGFAEDIKNEQSDVNTKAGENGSINLGTLIKYGCLGIQDIPILIVYLLNFLMGIIGSLSVLMIIYGGYLYILGGFQGDVKKATTTIQYAIIGLVVALFAWLIVNFVLANLTIFRNETYSAPSSYNTPIEKTV